VGVFFVSVSSLRLVEALGSLDTVLGVADHDLARTRKSGGKFRLVVQLVPRQNQLWAQGYSEDRQEFLHPTVTLAVVETANALSRSRVR
jgi:hypothetical protein